MKDSIPLKDSIPTKILTGFNPEVPCAWLPDHEVRLSEYMEMITHFVQKDLQENWDAENVYFKEPADKSE